MRLRVLSPDGSPASRTSVALFDVTNPDVPDFLRHVMGSRTDDGGYVEFAGRTDRSYVLARSTERSSQKAARSQPFGAEAAARGVTIVLPPE